MWSQRRRRRRKEDNNNLRSYNLCFTKSLKRWRLNFFYFRIDFDTNFEAKYENNGWWNHKRSNFVNVTHLKRKEAGCSNDEKKCLLESGLNLKNVCIVFYEHRKKLKVHFYISFYIHKISLQANTLEYTSFHIVYLL